MKIKSTKLLTLLLVLVVLAACGTDGSGESGAVTQERTANVPAYDREGFPITLPDQINSIISIGPSNTEVLVELGFGDIIVATDAFSHDIAGIRPGISVLNMISLDLEFIIDQQPDIVFVTGMTRVHGDEDPLSLVSDVGICVIYMPSSTSIAAIKEDIRFMAAVMDAVHAGESLIAGMEAELENIRQMVAEINERPRVYFEIGPAPHMWSFGTGTFLHEMIELLGAENIFADQYSWIPVADEVLVALNPDVILTSVRAEDPVSEILSRPGWNAITAVQEGAVFRIDTNASNRPSHNIVIALRQIAEAIHPEHF